MTPETPRWIASLQYRFEEGVAGITVGFEEWEHLAEVVERGPHWDSIVEITVKRLRDVDETMTVERGAEE